MNKNSILSSADNKLAGLQIDLLQKIKNGNISTEELFQFLNMKPKKRAEVFGIILPPTLTDILANWRDTAKTLIPGVVFYYNNEFCSDPDILSICRDAVLSSGEVPTGTYTMLPAGNKRTEAELLTEAQANNAVVDDIGIAIRMHEQGIKEGVFSKLKTYRCIFFKNGDTILKLWCRRNSDGELNLYVNELDPDGVWDDDYEFFARNNSN